MASGYSHTIPNLEFTALNINEDFNKLLSTPSPPTSPSTRLRKTPEESDPNIQQQTPECTPSPKTLGKKSVKLESRKSRRSSEPDSLARGKKVRAVGPESAPYFQYRARQRRDAGVDGESVWGEELESAFMEGMRISKYC